MKKYLGFIIFLLSFLVAFAQDPAQIIARSGIRGATDYGGLTNYFHYMVRLNSNGVFDASLLGTNSFGNLLNGTNYWSGPNTFAALRLAGNANGAGYSWTNTHLINPNFDSTIRRLTGDWTVYSNLNVLGTLTAETLVVQNITNTFLLSTNGTFVGLSASNFTASTATITNLEANTAGISNLAVYNTLGIGTNTPPTNTRLVIQASHSNEIMRIARPPGVVSGGFYLMITNMRNDAGSAGVYFSDGGSSVLGVEPQEMGESRIMLNVNNASPVHIHNGAARNTSILDIGSSNVTIPWGRLGLGVTSSTSRVYIKDTSTVLTNSPQLTLHGSANRNANYFEILPASGQPALWVDKSGLAHFTNQATFYADVQVAGKLTARTAQIGLPGDVGAQVFLFGTNNYGVGGYWGPRLGVVGFDQTAIVTGGYLSAYANGGANGGIVLEGPSKRSGGASYVKVSDQYVDYYALYGQTFVASAYGAQANPLTMNPAFLSPGSVSNYFRGWLSVGTNNWATDPASRLLVRGNVELSGTAELTNATAITLGGTRITDWAQTIPGALTNVVSVGAGTSLVNQVSGRQAFLKSQVPGSNIVITDEGTQMVWSVSGTVTNTTLSVLDTLTVSNNIYQLNTAGTISFNGSTYLNNAAYLSNLVLQADANANGKSWTNMGALVFNTAMGSKTTFGADAVLVPVPGLLLTHDMLNAGQPTILAIHTRGGGLVHQAYTNSPNNSTYMLHNGTNFNILWGLGVDVQQTGGDDYEFHVGFTNKVVWIGNPSGELNVSSLKLQGMANANANGITNLADGSVATAAVTLQQLWGSTNQIWIDAKSYMDGATNQTLIDSKAYTDGATNAVSLMTWADSQYPNAVLRNGSRSWTGTMDGGGNNLTNAHLINGNIDTSLRQLIGDWQVISNLNVLGTLTADTIVARMITNSNLIVTNAITMTTPTRAALIQLDEVSGIFSVTNSGPFSFLGTNMAVNGMRITGLGDGVSATDAVNYSQLTNAGAWYLRLDGSTSMAAPLKLSPGVLSAPSLTFAHDPTMGLYSDLGGTLRFGVSNTLAMSVKPGVVAIEKLIGGNGPSGVAVASFGNNISTGTKVLVLKGMAGQTGRYFDVLDPASDSITFIAANSNFQHNAKMTIGDTINITGTGVSTNSGTFHITSGADIGPGHTVSAYNGATTVGAANFLGGAYSFIAGTNSQTTANGAVAMGCTAIANGAESFAIGRQLRVVGANSIGINLSSADTYTLTNVVAQSLVANAPNGIRFYNNWPSPIALNITNDQVIVGKTLTVEDGFYARGSSNVLTAVATTAMTNHGVVCFGGGVFDGTVATSFRGASAGTYLAGNFPSTFTGSALDLQRIGTNFFKVNMDGSVYVAQANAPFASAGYYTGGYISRFADNYLSLYSGAGKLLADSGNRLWVTAIGGVHFTNAAVAHFTNGTVNVGSGGFGGAAGSFTGSVNGTILAINSGPAFTGNLIDAQLAGTNRFAVTSAGDIIGGGTGIITNFASAFFNSNSVWIGSCKLSSDAGGGLLVNGASVNTGSGSFTNINSDVLTATNLTVVTGLSLGGSNITSWSQISGTGGGGDIFSASNNIFTATSNTFVGTVYAPFLTNVTHITLGGDTRTAWPTGGAGGDIFAASNNVFTATASNTFMGPILGRSTLTLNTNSVVPYWNVFVNTDAGKSLLRLGTNATSSIAIGDGALGTLGSAYRSIAIGKDASGSGGWTDSIAIGNAAAQNGASYNLIAIGNSAGISGGAFNSSYNLYIGTFAGNACARDGISTNNTFVGHYSAQKWHIASEQNAIFGAYSGNTYASTNAQGNTFLGAATDFVDQNSAINVTNATAIGFRAKVGSSDTMVLGRSGTKVGIGTNANLAALLHVNGNVQVDGVSTFTGITNNGTLDVSGMTTIGGVGTYKFYANPAGTAVGELSAGVAMASDNNLALGAWATAPGGNKTALIQYDGSTFRSVLEFTNTVGGAVLPTLLLNKSGGKVGIATNSPATTLHVNGTSRFENLLTTTSNIVYGVSAPVSAAGALGTNSLNFLSAPYQQVALTNNVFLNPVNANTGLTVTVKFLADGSARNVIVTNDWKKLSGSLTNQVLANKIGVLSVTYFDADHTNAVMSWAAQP